MSAKAAILHAATELLAASPTGDISTRAVCDAAGVGQPVLYRHFGDKDGLIAAVVDAVWGEYLALKRAASPSADPVADLRAGWDAHMEFALEHRHAYRILFGGQLTTRPEAAVEAMGLLRSILDRIAAQGRLRLAPAEAARIVMAANTGVALGLILHPENYPQADIAELTREATLAGILAPASHGGSTSQEDVTGAVTVAAVTLRAALQENGAGSPAAPFSAAEAALLDEWLRRLGRGLPT